MKFCVNLDAVSLQCYKLEIARKVGLEEFENISFEWKKKN